MNLPLLSICIPNFNNEKYVSDCIESAKNVKWKNKEIIVVDDYSTDKSLIKIKKYKRHIRLIKNKKNIGQIRTTNLAVNSSKGKFVIILHSDDVLRPNIANLLIPHLIKNNKCGLAAGERDLIVNDKKHNNYFFYKNSAIIKGIEQARVFLFTSFLPCQVIFKREIFKMVKGLDRNYEINADGLLFFKMCLNTDFIYIKKKVCLYRFSADNTTSKVNQNANHIDKVNRTLNKMIKYGKKFRYLAPHFKKAKRNIAKIFLKQYIRDHFNSLNNELIKSFLIKIKKIDRRILINKDYKIINNILENIEIIKKNRFRKFSYGLPRGSVKI